MKTILDRIIEHKKHEVGLMKSKTPVHRLKEDPLFDRPPLSLKTVLSEVGSATSPDKASGIIAEFKRMSPTAGWIKRNADVEDVARGYVQAGATALSVLTDRKYFAGSQDDLIRARELNHCPILRKDFIIDPYQVTESKAIGADAILLIASVLEKSAVGELAELAHEVGLEVILELHRPSELDCLDERIDIVGVNNRDLKKMETDVQASIDLAGLIPGHCLKISESGIHDPETIRFLKGIGYHGFLIGEYFMKQEDPAKACRRFIESL
jgi:indole-3-glycerol phosphate synthase